MHCLWFYIFLCTHTHTHTHTHTQIHIGPFVPQKFKQNDPGLTRSKVERGCVCVCVWEREREREMQLPAPPGKPHCHLFKINLLFIYSFIYFWLRWVFVAARGLSLVVVSGGYSLLQCAGFSLRWLLLLRSTGSRRMGFRSCGTWAQ